MSPLLSILIATVPERASEAAKLIKILESQAEGKQAEILALSDNRFRSIGMKRNALLLIARGKYVAFCDDDDSVSDDYVATLCDMAKVDVDVLTFQQLAKRNGEESIIEFRIHYPINSTFRASAVTKRFPWHSCAWRRELAQQCVFTDKDVGEDHDWASQANELAQTEAYNPKILHYYTHRDNKSLAKR